MKCQACDVLLTNFESTRKILEGDKWIYPDLCTKCYMHDDNSLSTIHENFEAYNGEFDQHFSEDFSDLWELIENGSKTTTKSII